MARTSRRYETPKENPSKNIDKRFQAGIYTRISADRRYSKTRELSDSINGQILIAEEYVSNNPDICIREIYTDYEYSGTNFERPAFERMMIDIKKKKINCIIVKDLSRFGREYIQVGDYIETVFPFLGVRFISVNDKFDTEKDMSGEKSMEVIIKNLINDIYAKDISTKVKSSFLERAKKGYFIGSNPPYGYKKVRREGGYSLIIDPISAPIVQEIFKLFIKYMSAYSVTTKLNEDNIATPRDYYRNKNLYKINDYRWLPSTIYRILTNEAYLGHMVQGKTSQSIAKNIKKFNVPKKEQIVVKNTHEAIISQEDFELAQKILRRSDRIFPTKHQKKHNKYENILYCGYCGKLMNMRIRTQNKANEKETYYKYHCYRIDYKNNKKCKNSIKENELDDIVIDTIIHLLSFTIQNEEKIRKKFIDNLQNELDELKKEKSNNITKLKIEEDRFQLKYEEYVKGKINKEELLEYQVLYRNNIANLTKKQDNIENQLDDKTFNLKLRNKILDEIITTKKIKTLDEEILRTFIQKITLYRNKQVKVNFLIESIFDEISDEASL